MSATPVDGDRNVALLVDTGPLVIDQDVALLDLDVALLSVQADRASILESLLKAKIQEVKDTNELIGLLNDLMSALNAAVRYFPPQASTDERIYGQKAYEKEANNTNWALEREINDAFRALNINPGFNTSPGAWGDGNLPVTDPKYPDKAAGYFNNDVTNGQITKWVTDLKSAIDAQTNTQQTLMLNLQSMTNKRNEAYETMTNWIAKENQSNSGILSNLR